MNLHRLRHPLLITAICLVLCIPCKSEAGSDDRSFFWEIRSGKATAYILGSIHLMRSDAYPLRPAIEAAFERSDMLIVEADDIDDVDALQRMMRKSRVASEGSGLRSSLRPDTYERAGERLRQYGLDIAALESLRPWVLATMLTLLETQRHGLDPEHGVDRYFLQKAREQERRIVALESVEYQLNLMNSLSMDEQDALLLSTLEGLGDLTGQINRLMAAWESGDESAVEDLIVESVREQPFGDDLYRKIIFERNVNMATRIQELMGASGTAFVVVGAAHLVGEDGIISLLERRGYTAKRR